MRHMYVCLLPQSDNLYLQHVNNLFTFRLVGMVDRLVFRAIRNYACCGKTCHLHPLQSVSSRFQPIFNQVPRYVVYPVHSGTIPLYFY